MQLELLVALAIGIPIILFPAAFIWYVNFGGIVAAISEKANRAVHEKQDDVKVEKTPEEKEYEDALIEALKRYPLTPQLGH
jgi:hypothetical protein